MKNASYTHRPEDGIDELRLVTKSLLILASLTGVLYLRVFIVETFSAMSARGQGVLGLLSLALLVAATAGLLATWRWEGIGGLVATLSGLGLAVLSFLLATNNRWLTAFFYGSPFVITGGLSLVCLWQARVKRAADG